MKLRQMYLVARDPEALADALGLPVAFVDPGRWVQFANEGSAFCVAREEEGGRRSGQPVVPVFQVESLEGWPERVGEAGGKADGVRDMGEHGRLLTGRDPRRPRLPDPRAARATRMRRGGGSGPDRG